MSNGYPDHREVDVALRSGGSLRLRPVRPVDAEPLARFLNALDPEALALRFFTGGADVARQASEMTSVDYADRFGLVAVAGDGEILAHGMYARDGPASAEVAFAVAGRLQNEGVATAMLAHLADAARAQGMEELHADVLPANHRMVEVFRASGLRAHVRAVPGTLQVTMPAALDAEGQRRFDERDAVAAAAALANVLAPRSVAVIGASNDPASAGGAVVRNMLAANFTGYVVPVNPRARAVSGIAAAREVPGGADRPDLAIVVTPADQVLDAVRACGAAGVPVVLVVSAGYEPARPDAANRRSQLLEACRSTGVRLVGPASLGAINTDPELQLNASLAGRPPAQGSVGVLAQSGALGLALLDAARSRGLGISSFLSLGDKLDLSGNDVLAFWERDVRTRLGLLYLESFGNPRKFARVARRVSAKVPLLAVKGGRPRVSGDGDLSPLEAAVMASEAVTDALFAQAGVLRMTTLRELLDVADLLECQPIPRGRRATLVAVGGGLGTVCADALLDAGAELAAEVPLPFDATPGEVGDAVGRAVAAGGSDGVIALFGPSPGADVEATADAVRRAGLSGDVPVAVVAPAFGPPTALAGPEGRLPWYRFPEDAAHAFAVAAGYRLVTGGEPEPDSLLQGDDAAAAGIIAAALGRSTWLSERESLDLLAAYGARVDPGGAAHVGEPLAGAVAHPSLGPVVAALDPRSQRVAVRLAPIDASQGRLLADTLGVADGAALSDTLVRVGALVDAHPEIAAVELRVRAAGLPAGARVRLRPTAPGRPEPSLRAL
jgi:acyl-CoA synthetase (NDP forming)/GNAT superfamily N-acetyltransferase